VCSFLSAAILSLAVASAHDYAMGQVWTYHVRPGDEGSTLQINKIERDPKLGTIYHISIFDVHVPNPGSAGGFITEIPHLPVSEATLNESVESLLPQPARSVDYAEGYAIWKRAFDAGRAGIYTVSIGEIVSALEQTMGTSSK
jgi:hypothetical protein